ncbi:MAG: sodium ion-translocating decarboxylase subunit beta [Clostridia bacterium]
MLNLLLSTEGEGIKGLGEILQSLFESSGFAVMDWKAFVMIGIACLLLYLAIVKGFEPLLLLPIAFGALLINIPGSHDILFAAPDIVTGEKGGLLYFLYQGVDLVIYPPLIFLGIGAMTDFGPMIANPKTMLLGAAAQVGIFLTFIGAILLGFPEVKAAAIAIIGGADGPTAIYLASKLAPTMVPTIAIAAYSYMALVPIIQPPIMRLLTTKKERAIKMDALRPVSKFEKIVFPLIVTVVVGIMLPASLPLLGMLMLGNLMKESGVVERISKTAQNEMINIITILLGVSVGCKTYAPDFLNIETLGVLALGLFAFAVGTASGVLLAKLMNLMGAKINPLIGSAGVSAVPMAARISNKLGLEEDKTNYLLMHAMGPNVAGVIGSAIAAGVLLAIFG